MRAAFSEFSSSEVVPVVRVQDVYVAELFHGPTLAFKDFGQQVLCRLIDYFAVRDGRNATLVVSTTGDTGPAAIRAAAPSRRLKIVCFYPKGQISRLQELQMTTVDSPNVRVIAFEGGGDDMDALIKAITTDRAFRDRHGLCSVNSINWGRVAMQVVHWFSAYLQAARLEGVQAGRRMHFSVPTGAMGNVAAGLFAKMMGLPVDKILCGVNHNDIVHRAVATGRFHKQELVRTLSEAINIQVPYNFERVLYALSGCDAPLTRSWMRIMDMTKKLTLRGRHLRRLRGTFLSARVSDEEMLRTVREYRSRHGYLVDPHTAVALHACGQLGLARNAGGRVGANPARRPTVVLATAHAAKFEEAVRAALGDAFWQRDMPGLMPEAARRLEGRREVGGAGAGSVFREGEDWLQRLRGVVEAVSGERQQRRSRL